MPQLRRLRKAGSSETAPEDCISAAVSVGAARKQARPHSEPSSSQVMQRLLPQSPDLLMLRVLIARTDPTCEPKLSCLQEHTVLGDEDQAGTDTESVENAGGSPASQSLIQTKNRTRRKTGEPVPEKDVTTHFASHMGRVAATVCC